MYSQVKEKDALIFQNLFLLFSSFFFFFNIEALCYEIWYSLQLLTIW